MDLEAVAFDAYGTLCFIANKTNPLAPLLADLNVTASEARRLCMTRNLDLAGLVDCLAPAAGVNVAALERQVHSEVASVRLYANVEETLRWLKHRGLRLAVVSNLAVPYSEPVQRLLGGLIDEFGVCSRNGKYRTLRFSLAVFVA